MLIKINLKLAFLFLLSFLIIHSTLYITHAAIRYVSHNGSNTYPYTSWLTAADSIMTAINVSVFGDTIYVANGVYKERVTMIDGLTLIGAGADSCIIDSREFPYVNEFYTVEVVDSCLLSGFGILTYDIDHGNSVIIESGIISIVENCKMQEAYNGIVIFSGAQNKPMVYRNIIQDVTDGITTVFAQSIIKENIIYPREDGLISQLNSAPTYIDNIIICELCYFGFGDGGLTSKLKNNLFYGSGSYAFWSYGDSIKNNIIFGKDGNWGRGVFGAGSDIRNNDIENTEIGLYYDVGGGSPPIFQYNNLWRNQYNFQNFTPDSTNIYVDPMFVNPDSMDFHLQKYSPLIDAGDPNILDVDGSRSDIGVYGGPGGEMYTYQDLAPKPPANLTAVYDSGLVKLTWDKNTEADLFRYRVYRDTIPNFIYDTTKIIAVTADTFYFDDVPEKYLAGNYYYKVTAIDSAYHQSAASEEVHIIITGAPEGPPIVAQEYKLLNNYPNPFNPSTKIPYRLKDGGYVKLMVYDIKGELLKVLVNEYQNAGYYEIEFSPTEGEIKRGKLDAPFETGYRGDIASGIYLYRIEVIGDGKIPRFSEMKKMIYVK